MYKEFWFEDGYYAFGDFAESEIRRLKNDHGLIVRAEVYRIGH